jgi:hypothetical protein
MRSECHQLVEKIPEGVVPSESAPRRRLRKQQIPCRPDSVGAAAE